VTTGLGQVLARLAPALDAAGVTHMIVGAFASAMHGLPRTTHALDLMIDSDKYAHRDLVRALDDPSYHLDRAAALDAWAARTRFDLVHIESAWRIQLILRPLRPFSREALARRLPVVLDGAATFVATAEDTILAALERAQQGVDAERALRDAADIVGVQADALDRAYVETWAAELGVLDAWAQVRAG
jgi:hypothetical protein